MRDLALWTSETLDIISFAVILIRTFLSISLDVEINGHWPWETTRLQQQAVEQAREPA